MLRSLEELRREYDVRNKSRDLISKKLMGDKMKSGIGPGSYDVVNAQVMGDKKIVPLWF